jgi:uncharacterized protein (DUF697 family)
MQLITAPLASFLSALGLQAAATEEAEWLRVSTKIDGQAVKDLDYSVVEQLVECYGQSLTAAVLLGDLPELEIGPGITPQAFREKQANFVGGNSYDLQLRIDKPVLLGRVLGAEAARGNVHYFFATSVEGLFATGLDNVEKTIWGGTAEARRLLVGDLDVQRSGPAFQIVGGANLIVPFAALPPLPGAVSASIERMQADREEQISWDHRWVQRLTPVQLQLDGQPGDSRLEQLFAAAYVLLCLLYTCDRARRRPVGSGKWEAKPEYRGGQVTVLVPVREAQPIGTRLTDTMTRGFADLVDWCYRLRDEGAASDWAADRLQFTQVRIAQVLEPVPESARLVTLVDRITDVVAALDDQWRAFIEDRFGQYLDKERQLEGVVNDVVIAFAEKTTALAKGLSDTLLAAVAALIGSAIAAAFKQPFDAALFRVGVLVYAGYVLIFPGLYGLGSQVGQFLEISRNFEHERKRFNTLLGAEKTKQIVDDRVTRAMKRYWRWFGFTVAGYAIAIAGAIVAAVVVPSIVS